MSLWRTLAERDVQLEVMDQPDLDPAKHREALDALAGINFWSNSAGILWPAIREVLAEQPTRSLSILDLACGGGDIAIALWQRLDKLGIAATIEGRDLSPLAIDVARQRARRLNAAVRFVEQDAFEPAPGERFDIVTCSLFLHHLSRARAAAMLARMAASAERRVLVNDLLRSRHGYLLAWAWSHCASRSPVVRVDGPLSVAAAFTLDEARRLTVEAGLLGATVRRRWPCRYLLEWRRAPVLEPVECVASRNPVASV